MNKKEIKKKKEQLKLYIDNMFYDEELENYTEDEQELKKRIKDIIDTINNIIANSVNNIVIFFHLGWNKETFATALIKVFLKV